MKPKSWDGRLFHDFLEFFLYEKAAVAVGKQLFLSRAPSTWRIYMRSAVRLWKQASLAEVHLVPLTGDKLLKVLGSVPQGKWKALYWEQMRAYIKIICSLNGYEMDSRVTHLLRGQAKDNIVTMKRRKERPVFTAEQMKRMFFRVKAIRKSHVQQRALMALYMSYYAVGRSFDLCHLQGKHLDFEEDCIRINFHVKKNNPLALKRHVATIYSTFDYLCPVLNIMKAIIYLRIGPEDFLFHREGEKDEQIDPASLIASVKAVQIKAKSVPALTLTDVRASATSALAESGVSSYLIQLWGGWSSSQLKNYARSNVTLRKSIQAHLEP